MSAYGTASASTSLASCRRWARNGAGCAAPQPVSTRDKVCYSERPHGGHDPVRLRGILVIPHEVHRMMSTALSRGEDKHG